MAKVTITAGKGGVGKTLIAVSLASYMASRDIVVGLIDYDGGHSVQTTLGLAAAIPCNRVHQVSDCLSVVVIDTTDYVNITEAKERKWPFSKYMDQFPTDAGIIPFSDMVSQFFGVPTDTPALQKFTTLVASIIALKKAGCAHIVIDVEPTAGLERLLSNADSMVLSLQRLQNKGLLFLGLLGAKWPDIKDYLKSDYIRNIEHYTEKIMRAVEDIRRACFLLVCTPELSPANQTFAMREIIEKFGGTISGCVVNNIRGEDQEGFVLDQLSNHWLPILKIAHSNGLHASVTGREEILLGICKNVFETCN